MDFLINLIDFNEGVNYTVAVYCLVTYLLLLWVVVAAWVARDSYKRYEENRTLAAVWFVVVLTLNFPALMFYLVMRPEDQYNDRYFGGGVDVPIANFVGKDGEVLMGIQLKINSSELTESARDMRLSIDWESADPNKQMTTEAVVAEAREVKAKINSFQKVLSVFKQSATMETAGESVAQADAKPATVETPAKSESREVDSDMLQLDSQATDIPLKPSVEANDYAARRKKKKKRR